MSARNLPGVTVESFPYDDKERILEFSPGTPVFGKKRKPKGKDRPLAPMIDGTIGWLLINEQFHQVFFRASRNVWRLVKTRALSQYSLSYRFPGCEGGGD